MKMHWCTGKVNLAGQSFTILVIDKIEPISWPEAQVLMALHGEENIYDLKPCAISITEARAEKERLWAKYGKIVEQVFPGYTPRMEMLMPAESEAQPLADAEGKVTDSNGNGEPLPGPAPDDDDDGGDENATPPEPPIGPAVFKPGKHQRPAKGA